MLTRRQQIAKRTFDVVLSAIGLVVCALPIAFAMLIARLETRRSGIFRQTRVGQSGQLFAVYKIRTMRDLAGVTTHVTRQDDPRITRWGRLFRLTKIDELPQLFNVLKGDMSLVGPRPDVPEVAWRLAQDAPLVLTVRPGITGPASLKYRDEEEILEWCIDPEWYSEAVLFPDKMRINAAYVREYRWHHDLKYLWQTISGTGERASTATSQLTNPCSREPPEMTKLQIHATDWVTKSWPVFDEEMIEAAAEVLRSGKVNYWTGSEGRQFETEFAEFVGTRHAIALANGTLALELALHALGIGPGDEVIVPSRTFIATASSVVARGARPVCRGCRPR